MTLAGSELQIIQPPITDTEHEPVPNLDQLEQLVTGFDTCTIRVPVLLALITELRTHRTEKGT